MSCFHSFTQNNAKTEPLRFLFGYIRQYQKYFGLVLVGLLAGCGLQLLLPFLTQTIVDVGVKHHNLGFVRLILLGLLMVVVSRATVDLIRRWLLLHICMRINVSLVSDFFVKLPRLPIRFFNKMQADDLMERMDDHERVENFLTTWTLNVVFSLLGFVVFGAVLFCYSHEVFLVFLAGSIVHGVWISIFLNRRKTLDHEIIEKQTRKNNKVYDLITSMQEIKLQDCEQRRRLDLEFSLSDLIVTKQELEKQRQTQEVGSRFISELTNVIVTVMSATAVINGEMTLGMMLATQYIIGQQSSPVEQLMGFISALHDVKNSLKRIGNFHQLDDEDCGRTVTPEEGHESIKMDDVCFKYSCFSPQMVIDHVSFTIPKGKMTAIVGPSGSGKTTLLKLILGYYDAKSGHIAVGGNDISTMNLKTWRCRCGVVMQDGVIFPETIARNIAVGDGGIDKDRMLWAAEMACAMDMVMRLPLNFGTMPGYDSIILSHELKQRIMIARAIYKDPDFIFLDEATDSLDADSERTIMENLGKFRDKKTVVVVANRLNAAAYADNIIVMDGGRVAETGDHKSLMESRGVYYNLVKSQLCDRDTNNCL